MRFTSLLFIFIFLPISTLLYWILPNKWWKNAFLLISSLFFYTWGEPLFVFLLIFLVILNWILGTSIEKYNDKNKQGLANDVKVLAIVLNLLPLLLLKLFTIQYSTIIFGINISDNFAGLSIPGWPFLFYFFIYFISYRYLPKRY